MDLSPTILFCIIPPKSGDRLLVSLPHQKREHLWAYLALIKELFNEEVSLGVLPWGRQAQDAFSPHALEVLRSDYSQESEVGGTGISGQANLILADVPPNAASPIDSYMRPLVFNEEVFRLTVVVEFDQGAAVAFLEANPEPRRAGVKDQVERFLLWAHIHCGEELHVKVVIHHFLVHRDGVGGHWIWHSLGSLAQRGETLEVLWTNVFVRVLLLNERLLLYLELHLNHLWRNQPDQAEKDQYCE